MLYLFAALLLSIKFGDDTLLQLLERQLSLPIEQGVYDAKQHDHRDRCQDGAHNLGEGGLM